MRIRLLCMYVLVTLCGSALAYAAEQPTYYLALGDSLSQGVQLSVASGTDILTNRGYVDDLYAFLRLRNPGLQLAKLGCPGETTATFINGGPCSTEYQMAFGKNDQLDAAVVFLATHDVQFITLDIGGNDVDGCIVLTQPGINGPCFAGGITSVSNNLPLIVNTLRAAAPRALIIGMNYYDPFLAAWKLIPGPAGQTLAEESVFATTTGIRGVPGLNSTLESVYGAAHIPVADVAKAFQITNFTELPFINLPLNVFLTLSWTWMSATPPDIHPNDAGYAVIAGAFLEEVGDAVPFSGWQQPSFRVRF
jgi:lysophospholipase L1-like esterase